jgi:hypothetical protein
MPERWLGRVIATRTVIEPGRRSMGLYMVDSAFTPNTGQIC